MNYNTPLDGSSHSVTQCRLTAVAVADRRRRRRPNDAWELGQPVRGDSQSVTGLNDGIKRGKTSPRLSNWSDTDNNWIGWMVTEWAPLKPNEWLNYSATFSTLRIQGVLQVGHGLRFKEDHGVATGYWLLKKRESVINRSDLNSQ